MSTLPDRTVASVLGRAAGGVGPVLDAVASDPLGIKARTFSGPDPDRTALGAVLDAAAGVLDALTVPGTAAWENADPDRRARWWVTRLGALNTIVVAAPSMFGILLNRLPLQNVLGFANQVLVVVAVAREYGVTDRSQQIDLLAEVVLGRRLDPSREPEPAPEQERPRRRAFAVVAALWRTARTVRAIGSELDRRPSPGPVTGTLSNIPVIGVPARYVGERLALRRAAGSAREWSRSHRTGDRAGV
ncbi:hypothetical protein DW322_18330 [Rhodococcus rhodnii]|uniref:Uncharacterized protein n=2 Tax=Rhodococcus rhodnii TaxID=38312 RepID=R7WLE4_9NOCA|nr:hypothetical protein [Rhodococcus rhodnii]EOM76127.1 hypothetical protein Rrhod_2493 [Rhodococcus rhodnii LMG 5362]TXG91783.1 hypothetical protein DW322_18330 [Rhodococcus rhodnii]